MRGSAMAFFDYRLLGNSMWVGVDNFGDLLYDTYWWSSVWNALRYSFLVMSLTFLPPIILAVFLQEIPKGQLLFRTIYYLPAVVTGLVTVLLWKQFFDPSEMGMLNAVMLRIPAIGFIILGIFLCIIALLFANRLRFYGFYWGMSGFIIAGIILLAACSSPALSILFPSGDSIVNSFSALPSRLLSARPEPFRWLSDPNTSMLSCVIPMVWAGMGPGCLIYLAALKGIPNDYYEAADIDGATFIDKILFVVLPHLKFLIIINFVGAFISSWYSATGNILVMTGGGAGTETAGLHIWYKAFTYLKFGPATAMAWMLGFILIGFTVHQLRMLSKVEFKATGNK
jgi:multiple sugar transport system permease protein